MLALRQNWGDQVWRDWCSGLLRNGAKVVDGNSLVVRLVGSGECWIGLTDSDDIAAGQRQGLPIASVPSIKELLVIPSTIATISGSPHRQSAAKLVEFLTDFQTLQHLVKVGALQGVNPQPFPSMKVDWSSPNTDIEELNQALKLIFLRS
jgi:ABC-type Fe3+ transport system substrate-binding protein